MRVVALIAILGLDPRKSRTTGGHSCTSLANRTRCLIRIDRFPSAGSGEPGEASQNRLAGTVRAVAFLGNLVDYRVEVAAGTVLRVQGDPHAAVGVGERVHLAFDPAATWSVPPREGEAA